MKKALLALSVVVMACSTLFAQGSSETTSTSGEKQMTVGFIVGSRQHVFYNLIEDGINKKAKELGIKAIVLDGQLDGNITSNHISDLIAERVDAVALSCNDPGGTTPAMESADRESIPVFTFDCTSETTDVVKCFVGTDNYQGGYLAGEYAVEHTPKGGKVGIIWDVPQSVVDRHDGFIKAVEESDKGLKIIDVGLYSGDAAKAESLMTDSLTTDPDIAYVFCGGDPAATGALAGIKAAGATTKVIGFDGNPEAKQAMTDETNGKYWVAEVAQDPEGIGEKITEEIYQYLSKGTVDQKVIKINPYLFTASDL